jgi:hypothetical protein
MPLASSTSFAARAARFASANALRMMPQRSAAHASSTERTGDRPPNLTARFILLTKLMRDIEYIEHKGRFNIKAITPLAREVMGKDMRVGDTWKMAADVFFMHVQPDKLRATLDRLEALGLKTEDEKESFDVESVTTF